MSPVTLQCEQQRDSSTHTYTHTSRTICLNGSRDILAEALVDVEHVEVNPSQLDDKGVSHGFTGSDVGFQDAAQLLHRLRVLQNVHVLQVER